MTVIREFKVEANVGAPQVAYKETFTKAVDQEYKYAKQSGGRGQYGHCKGFRADGCQRRYSIPRLSVVLFRRYIPAIVEGIEEATKAGSLFLIGYPNCQMKSILPRWHSILPDLCVSRKLWLRQLQYYLSLS